MKSNLIIIGFFVISGLAFLWCSSDKGGNGHSDASLTDVKIEDASEIYDTEFLPDITSGDTSMFECIYRPPTGKFNPKLLWEWTGSKTVAPDYNEVIALPVVVSLTDDNGDGKIDSKDTPDVVFISFSSKKEDYDKGGVLRVVSGEDGSEICSFDDPQMRLAYESGLAAGDIDGDGIIDIIALEKNRVWVNEGGTDKLKLVPSYLFAFNVVKNENGEGYLCLPKKKPDLTEWVSSDVVNAGWGSPTLADLDGDGKAEIVVGNVVFDYTGKLLWKGQGGNGGMGNDLIKTHSGSISVVADINNDGKMEVIAGNTVYKYNGEILWQRNDLVDGLTGVADMNLDGEPDIVLVAYNSTYILDSKGNTICGPTSIPGSMNKSLNKGGAPIIADFNGDGKPEYGVAGAEYFVVFDNQCKILWQSPTSDKSSNVTGASVFDFEGDGKAEAVYNDELYLRVYNGKDGQVLFQTPNTTNTTFEYPLIVDVNNDNKAEIVVIANTICYQNCSPNPNHGVRVYADTLNNWVSTRKIWNQHAYHITNICTGEGDGFCEKSDDKYGAIPRNEIKNWKVAGLNNFRQNVQGTSGFKAPDLLITAVNFVRTECPNNLWARVTIRNEGEAPVGKGLNVAMYYGKKKDGGRFVGLGKTTKVLYPGDYTDVDVKWYQVDVKYPVTLEFVVDDDGEGHEQYNECREDNNNYIIFDVYCEKEG